MNLSDRRTKIVCTLGPSSNTEEMIDQLVRNGMDVARINFSHGTHEDHSKIISIIRKVADRYNLSLPILADLQGPKIRVGKMKGGSQELHAGDYVTLTSEEIEGTSEMVPLHDKDLAKDAAEGNKILMDDGLLEVEDAPDNEVPVVAQVDVDGELESGTRVSVPDVK